MNNSHTKQLTRQLNLTCYAFQKHSPIPEAKEYVVLNEYNEPTEFPSWEEATEFYRNQSNEMLVGLWRIFALTEVTITMH
jgi:hypothetical protein